MLDVDTVAALAPDAASLKAGRALATASQWPLLGRDAVLLWGDCRGSGAAPYRVTIEPASVEYACTCPSRTFPCKHVIGLLLLFVTGGVPPGKPPERALAWLVQREMKRRAKSERVAVTAAIPPAGDAAREAAAHKRAVSREARVAAGLDEMERWLCDVVRLGLANVQREPATFWHAKAARLVDAQAPGLARRVRELGELRGPDSAAQLLAGLGSLFLVREAYARLDELSPERRGDLRRRIGFTQREDDALLRPEARVTDRWTVIGARSDDDERVVAHRAWLAGERTGRRALVLQFALPNATPVPLALAVPSGAAFEGTLAYFDACVPQRAVVVERGPTVESGAYVAGASVAALLDAYAADVARDPWLESVPVALALARTTRRDDRWYAVDAEDAALPLTRTGQDPFELHAICGNRPAVLYGEWNGVSLLALGIHADGRFVRLR